MRSLSMRNSRSRSSFVTNQRGDPSNFLLKKFIIRMITASKEIEEDRLKALAHKIVH